MSGILILESLTRGNTLKQGDKTPLKYRLFDADGEKLNIAGKSAKVRLVYPDFLTIGYEKDGLTVAQDDTVTFTIDSVIPSRVYHVEIIVDDKFIFPSRADESKFTVDKSSFGTETNIIEIVGVDAIVRKAVDLINDDPSLIIDEDKLVGDIISSTGIGNIEEYYQQFNEGIDEFTDLKPKALTAITKSAEALTKSQNALNVANGIDAKATNALSLSESADTLSKSVQEQFNQVVIDGDSSVEAAQARVDASGQTNPSLKARLDKEHNEVTTQLAQKAQQTALEVEKERINNLIALPDGSTTNDARLEDIAIGYDGTVYNSPGEAVRTQLEEITKGSWNLTNEVVNGDFSTPDISHITSTTLDLEVVDGRLKASKSNWTYTSGSTIIIQNAYSSWDEGDIYYVKCSLKVIGDTQNPFRFGGYDRGISVNANNYRELNVVSGVLSPPYKNFVIRHFLNSAEYVEIILDNFVSINLTKTFGAGNEPTNEEMDELLELLGGWFEGTAKESLVTLWKFSTSSNSGTLDSVLTTENETWEVF